MSDFLARLAQRQLGQIVSVEPRIPDLYAPVSAAIPMPIIEELPHEISESRRINRAPTPADKPTSAQSASAAISHVSQEVPRDLVDPVQRLVTEPRKEHFSPLAMESASTEVAPRVDPRMPQRFEPKLAASSETGSVLRPRSKPEQRDSFSLRPEAPASELFFTRQVQPHAMTAEAVTSTAAPPRLELKLPSGGELAEGGRAHAGSEPPVQVTIGRIEVTALSAAAAPKRAPAARKQGMSLDDYLARRRGER